MPSNDKYHLNIDDLHCLIALGLLKTTRPQFIRKLINVVGSPKDVFELKHGNHPRYRIPVKLFRELKNKKTLEKAEDEVNFALKNDIRIISYFDPKYPERLKECIDAPLILFTKGEVSNEPKHFLSVVGTRKCSQYGVSICEKLVGDLIGMDICIVSGLALGIDSFAHSSALKNQIKTMAVLGHGLNKIYPSKNKALFEEISSKGALITEFGISSEVLSRNFPSRNRIIAGMSDATLVVESAQKGGSLITAQIANSYNRDVFAIPGRTSDLNSKGCNNLIKNQGAALVENAQDIIELMGWEKSKSINTQISLFEKLNKKEKHVVKLIRENDQIHVDTLINISDLNMSDLSSILLQLELKNIISKLPGKLYVLKA